MNKCKGFSKLWFLALLLVTFVAGCAGNSHESNNAGSPRAITVFSLNGTAGTVDETGKAISVTVPYGTDVKALVATFTTTGSTVAVGTTPQVSGTTTNDFTSPVKYLVTDANGISETYTVAVKVALSSAKAITAFSFGTVTGTIDDAAKTIAVTMPFGTDLKVLAATFTTTGKTVAVGTTPQVSGTTTNDFTSPVKYLVTDANGITETYTVTVTPTLGADKAITAFSFGAVNGIINEGTKNITVTMPSGTVVTALVAKFTIKGKSVTAGILDQVQTSGTTPNDFTNPVTYTVTANDTTKQPYTVTVILSSAVAKGPAPVLLGGAGNYVILATSKVSTVPASVITGDIGLYPAATSFLTGFSYTMVGTTSATSIQVTGSLFGADMTAPTSTNLNTAVNDMGTAYVDAAGRPTPDFLNQGTGELGGLTLAPGLYNWTTGVTISDNVTISGGPTDTWIFQIPGNLSTSPAKQVKLSGGALAKNIVWQVAGSVTIDTGSHFEGIILSKTSIALNAGASLNGRALAQTAVTLNTATVTKP